MVVFETEFTKEGNTEAFCREAKREYDAQPCAKPSAYTNLKHELSARHSLLRRLLPHQQRSVEAWIAADVPAVVAPLPVLAARPFKPAVVLTEANAAAEHAATPRASSRTLPSEYNMVSKQHILLTGQTGQLRSRFTTTFTNAMVFVSILNLCRQTRQAHAKLVAHH